MDKNAIKKYAVWARRELIARVAQRAALYEITEGGFGDPDAQTAHGRVLTDEEKAQRQALVARIRQESYQQVMEEVAYTWFNRFIALRFMEVNGYLPSRVRVFTDENNQFKPQILAEAMNLELDGLDPQKVYAFKNANDDGLFKYMIIVQCNALSTILPRMFQHISDYTELLFPDNLLREGSVVEQMISAIPEDDWRDAVQIIGWLYQYYNAEKKDEVFAALKKNVKITKENIPAATQLFTPDWIVRYMVENSLGRLWVEGHPNDELKSGWKYYLEEAEQEPGVQAQLAEIRKEYATMTPEQIKCIDPCCGSGHILAYLFDVLVQIYESYGYTTREAVESIVKDNLYGLDIDDRAAQLAYFAVMMKARQYDHRFFSRQIQPNVYAIRESNDIDKYALDYFCNGDAKLKAAMGSIVKEMHDAKEYGSILNITPVDFAALYARFDEVRDDISISKETVLNNLLPLVQVAEVLAQKYDVVVTNPPYMGKMPAKMTEYVVANFPESRYDLYSVFIEKCAELTYQNGYAAMITQHTWMFISSFDGLRRKMLRCNWCNLVHLGTRAFEAIGGEVVQTVAFVFGKRMTRGYCSVGSRLVDYDSAEAKEMAFLCHKDEYSFHSNNFEMLPGSPYVYWLSDKYYLPFDSAQAIENYVERKAGVVTGNDPYFVRLWYEPLFSDISLSAQKEYAKYHIMQKGGGFRRYYGNNEYVIRLADLYKPEKTNASVRRGDADYYFKKAIGWSQVGNAGKTFRLVQNSVCGTATPTVYLKDGKLFEYILAFLNTKVAFEYLAAYNPTINLLTTDICNIPLLVCECKIDSIRDAVKENIAYAQNDWDSFETSWDFKQHPLIRPVSTVAGAFAQWEGECDNRFNQLKANEEELNRIFIDIYGLQDELTPEVEDKDVTVRKADLQRDVKGLISYAVGCMFGRYSLDVDGLAYAGGEWDGSKYATYPADKDNIIPICDDEYFEDDIVGRFVKFIETVYGSDTLEENLKFIADALGGKGTPRDVIRSYFLDDFYADHCKTYQKRPIYWLFDSGKKNGFKALIYMHRYQPDTIARIRTDYVHEQQARYRTAIADLESRIAAAATGERVKLNKQLKKLQEQDSELRAYEEKIHHLADQIIAIDLDDGVKVNYAKFQDVLAKIK